MTALRGIGAVLGMLLLASPAWAQEKKPDMWVYITPPTVQYSTDKKVTIDLEFEVAEYSLTVRLGFGEEGECEYVADSEIFPDDGIVEIQSICFEDYTGQRVQRVRASMQTGLSSRSLRCTEDEESTAQRQVFKCNWR